MGRCIGLVSCVLIIVAAVLDGAAAQKTHLVLEKLGWIVPSAGPNQYATWASVNTFVVGDTLIFNFTTGQHDVAEVSETDYNSCNGNNPKGSILRTGPVNITLNSEGNHYYICTFSQHCTLGQRLEINVDPSSGNAPTSSPGPTSHILPPSSATTPPANCTPTPTPPPTAHTPTNSPNPTSMSTILFANLSVLLLSIAICFLV